MVTWRAYGLDLKDYEIFLSLKKNPLQSNAEIGRSVKLSSETVRSRVHAMKSKGFLRADRKILDPVLGERTQTESNGIYLPSTLGLLRHHLILQGIPDRTALKTLKRFCDEHPYTHYRVPAYGNSAALYIQFDIPPQIEKSIKKLIDFLKSKRLFSDYFTIEEYYFSMCNADFSKWDTKRNVWKLGLREDSSLIPDTSSLENVWQKSTSKSREFDVERTIPRKSYDFDNLDLRLLREITINSKPVLTAISSDYTKDTKLNEEFKKDSTTFSRRISKLREHVVNRDQLYYDRRVFDLTYPQLISGTFRDGSDLTLESLHNFISSGALPFDTSLISDGKSFLLYSTAPPSIAPELSELIWDHAQNICVLQLQLDASKTYFFYQENYINNDWIVDREYIVDDPLSRAGI